MLSVLDVLLRGLILAAQATAVGGVCFLLLVARGPEAPRSLLLIAVAAVTLALGQALSLANELFVLLHEAAWPLRAALDTLYVQVSVVRIAAGLALAACAARAAARGRAVAALARGGGAGARCWWWPPRGRATPRRGSTPAPCCWCSTASTSSAPRCGSAGSCT